VKSVSGEEKVETEKSSSGQQVRKRKEGKNRLKQEERQR
jgi:hypothetical protein